MRQFGQKRYGSVTRYFYGCQDCQHTAVWRETDKGYAAWEKKGSDNFKKGQTTPC